MTTSKASVALLQRVAEVALQAVEDDNCSIATTPTSTPIMAEHLEVLADPAKFTSSPALLTAAVQLSKIVDLVQDGSPVFDWQRLGQSFLSDTYQTLIGNVAFAKAQLSGDALADFEAAEATLYDDAPFDRTPAYEQFVTLASQVSQAKLSLYELRQQRTGAAEEERQALDERIAALTEALGLQEGLLSALDAEHGFTAARKLYEGAQVASFPPSYAAAADMLATTLLSIDDGRETHVRALFCPDRIVEANWTTVRVNRADIAAAPTEHPLVPPPPAGDRVATLDDAVIDSIELDVQVLTVERPWMWDGLFNNRMWKWLTPDEPVSDGQSPAHGKVPGYTQAVVVARNLKINGQQKLADAATATVLPLLRLANFNLTAPTRLKLGQTLRLDSTQPALQQLRLQARAVPMRAAPPTTRLSLPGPVRATRFAAASLRSPVPAAPASGVVRGRGGAPLADASVSASLAGGGSQQVRTTGADGAVALEVPTAGTYTLVVAHPAFETSTTKVDLAPGGSFEIALESKLKASMAFATLASSVGVRAAPVRDLRSATVLVRDHRSRVPDDILERPGRDLPVRPRPGGEPRDTNQLTVRFAKLDADGGQRPIDAPVRVEVRGANNATVQVASVQPGATVSFALPPAAYRVWAYCEVYDGVGQPFRDVDLSADQDVGFTFRPRTILESNGTFLMCYVVRRTPKSPDPDPLARF